MFARRLPHWFTAINRMPVMFEDQLPEAPTTPGSSSTSTARRHQRNFTPRNSPLRHCLLVQLPEISSNGSPGRFPSPSLCFSPPMRGLRSVTRERKHQLAERIVEHPVDLHGIERAIARVAVFPLI